MFTHEDNGPYLVKRLDGDFRPVFTTVAAGFPRRSAGFAWLVDWATANGYSVVCHDIDTENDASDIMLAIGSTMVQYAVERTKAVLYEHSFEIHLLDYCDELADRDIKNVAA